MASSATLTSRCPGATLQGHAARWSRQGSGLVARGAGAGAAELVGLEGHLLRAAGLVGDDQDDLAGADGGGGDADDVVLDGGGHRDRRRRARRGSRAGSVAAAAGGEQTQPDQGRTSARPGNVTARAARKRHCTVRPRADAVAVHARAAPRTAEFVALDTETNGLGGDRCELTEVGWVLVGGGELHEEWELARRRRAAARRATSSASPASRRTWSTRRPRPRTCCRELADALRDRVLVAHNARFDVRVLSRRSRAPRWSGPTRR